MRIPRPGLVAQRGDDDARVSTLELFFDLVFVLALTQCTALMASDPTFGGIGRALVVLALTWWSWVGYAWLTSVVDPERVAVRLPVFAVMAAFLVAALAIPAVVTDAVWPFVGAYAIVRAGQIILFALGSQGEPQLGRSIAFLASSTAVGVGLVVVGATFDGDARFALWAVAALLDMAGPFLFGAEGWKLVPGHFAERHGLILIIALGESIVALGVGADAKVDGGVMLAATLGTAAIAAMWWIYFDVLAHAAEHALGAKAPGKERNEAARDGYSLLHLPMVAGVVLVALGLKKTLGHVEDDLKLPVACALCGGAALYLLGRAGFGRRVIGQWSMDTFVAVAALLAVIPIATRIPALASLAIVAAILVLLVVDKAVRYRDRRLEVRGHVLHGHLHHAHEEH